MNCTDREPTDEEYEKLKALWEEQGDCGSCGWFPCFYEVYNQVFPAIFCTEEDSLHVCCIGEGGSEHRGTYLTGFKAIVEK